MPLQHAWQGWQQVHGDRSQAMLGKAFGQYDPWEDPQFYHEYQFVQQMPTEQNIQQFVSKYGEHLDGADYESLFRPAEGTLPGAQYDLAMRETDVAGTELDYQQDYLAAQHEMLPTQVQAMEEGLLTDIEAQKLGRMEAQAGQELMPLQTDARRAGLERDMLATELDMEYMPQMRGLELEGAQLGIEAQELQNEMAEIDRMIREATAESEIEMAGLQVRDLKQRIAQSADLHDLEKAGMINQLEQQEEQIRQLMIQGDILEETAPLQIRGQELDVQMGEEQLRAMPLERQLLEQQLRAGELDMQQLLAGPGEGAAAHPEGFDAKDMIGMTPEGMPVYETRPGALFSVDPESGQVVPHQDEQGTPLPYIGQHETLIDPLEFALQHPLISDERAAAYMDMPPMPAMELERIFRAELPDADFADVITRGMIGQITGEARDPDEFRRDYGAGLLPWQDEVPEETWEEPTDTEPEAMYSPEDLARLFIDTNPDLTAVEIRDGLLQRDAEEFRRETGVELDNVIRALNRRIGR